MKTSDRILLELKAFGPLSVGEVAASLEMCPREASRELIALTIDGHVARSDGRYVLLAEKALPW